jgi:hypothetical protein
MSVENPSFSDGGRFAEAMLATLRQFCTESDLANKLGLQVDSIQPGENPFIPSIETRIRVTRPVTDAERPRGLKFRAIGEPILTFTFLSSTSVEQNIKEFEQFISARAEQAVSIPKVIHREKGMGAA